MHSTKVVHEIELCLFASMELIFVLLHLSLTINLYD
jgi:hypothetical protein